MEKLVFPEEWINCTRSCQFFSCRREALVWKSRNYPYRSFWTFLIIFFNLLLIISRVSVVGFWCKIAFWKRLLFIDYTIKFSEQNFANFIVKLGSKAEICWNSEQLSWIFLNNSEVSSYLLWHTYCTGFDMVFNFNFNSNSKFQNFVNFII